MDTFYSLEVASSSDTDPETLTRILSLGRDDAVSCAAADNPRCSAATLERIVQRGLKQKGGTGCLVAALRNRSCPIDILLTILRRDVWDHAAQAIMANPSLPFGVLVEILTKFKDDNLRIAALRHPHCPEHLIESVASGPRSSRATIHALGMPQVSAETLVKVVGAIEADPATYAALKHSRLPAGVPHAILARDFDDEISHWAAAAPHVEMETIRMVLSRGRKDGVSKILAARKECPSDLRVKWMEDIGELKRILTPEEIERKERLNDIARIKVKGIDL